MRIPRAKFLPFLIIVCLALFNNVRAAKKTPKPRKIVMPVMPSNAVPSSMVAYWAEVVQTQLASSGPTMKSSAQIEDNQSVVCGLANGQSAVKIMAGNADKIVGGAVTSPNEFPWQVYLLMALRSGGMAACGGSLIDSRWILTAAHCLDGAVNVTVYLGAQDVSATKEPNRIVVNSKQMFIHPEWNSNTLKGDLALIGLPVNITFNNYIRPVCLPPNSTDASHVGDPVTITGWGKIADSGTRSPVLRKANTTVISRSLCQNTFGSIITSAHICSLGSRNGSTCNGDSGGPMNLRNADGTWTAIGIVSFGSSKGCTYGYPDAFTRISFYLDWIEFTKTNVTLYSSAPSSTIFKGPAMLIHLIAIQFLIIRHLC